jgi:hypothetical protein
VQTPNTVQMPVQLAWGATAQVPSGSQQEPVGWTHGFGVQTPNTVQMPVQLAWVATIQVPSGAQQAPAGWTHGFGVQTPNIVQVPVQPAWVVTEQAPSGSQHAPVGCEQGFGVQTVSAPCQMLGDWHADCVVTAQLPAGAQHAPVAISTPIPAHDTAPNDGFPVATRQVLLPAEVGSKRTVTSSTCPAPRA